MAGQDNYWQHGGRTNRRRLLRGGALGVAGLGAAWLAACGGGEEKKDSGQQAAATAAAPPAQPTQQGRLQDQGTPKPGGTFTWREVGNAPLDPTNNPTYRAQQLAAHAYSRLLKFNIGPDPNVSASYEIKPDLAAKYEVLDGGLQYTFTLQPNAKFHNKPPINGRAVTSEDVKASLERFRSAPKNTNKAALNIITSLETPDAKTVVVKIGQPYAPLLNLLANSQYLWIHPKEMDTGFNPDKEQIGSGPWVFDKVEPDVATTYKKNPEWFIQGKPYFDEVKMAIVPDTAQAIAQFQAGRLDYAGIPSQNKADVEKSNPKSQVITYIPTTYTFLSPQLRGNTPFKDPRVRRALSMAIDRKAWLDLLYAGQGNNFLSAVPASMGKWWLNPQSSDAGPAANHFKYDPKAARELLKAAGQENMPLRFIYTNNAYGDTFNNGADATAAMLKEAGFNTQLVVQDYLREYIDAKGTFFGTYEGVFYGLQTPFTDPHDYLFNMNHPKSTRNHAGVDDPKLTEMIDDEQKTIDENARLKKVHDIQKYWLDNMFYVPIAVGNAYLFIQPWIKKLYYSGNYGFPTEAFTEAWIDKS